MSIKTASILLTAGLLSVGCAGQGAPDEGPIGGKVDDPNATTCS
jgi:hypothetical protein